MFKAYCFQEGDVYFTEDEIPEGSLLICSGRKSDVEKAIYENCIEGNFDNGKQLMIEKVNTTYKLIKEVVFEGNEAITASDFFVDTLIDWIVKIKKKYINRPIFFSQ